MARQIQQSHGLNRVIRHHLRPLAAALSLGLGCAAVMPAAWADEESAAVLRSSHSFDIPSQSLSSALISFGQQSGLQVTVDAALLENRQSNPVKGQLNSEQALALLLHNNSGITWRFEDGNLLFELAPQSGTNVPLELGTTVVLGEAEENSFQGAKVIRQNAIASFPGANGDITTLLRMHPSVQFKGNQQSSNTPGEIAPADISINGAKYYQNNFMIDGISVNNDLDPGSHSYNDVRQYDSAPSRSQGIALDADLLEEIRVYDSNVPAEYGGFNGGVVDAITRRPTEELHGKLSAQMTRSEWVSYHITGEDEEGFETASNEQYQPEFRKLTVRGTLEGHLTEDFGAILNFSQKTSVIPLNSYADGYQSPNADNKNEQTRSIDNYLLKTYWRINDRLTLDSSFTYAPSESEYFTADRRNSDYTNEDGGYQASFKATWDGDAATFTHKLALTDLSTSRDANADELISWYYSPEKNWGNPNSTGARSIEGSFGSLEQSEKALDYSVKAQWVPVAFAGLEHNFTNGMELSIKDALWEREQTVTGYTTMRRDNGTTCAAGDRFCSVSPLLNGMSRQWSSAGVIYGAGKIELTEKKYAFYFEDKVQLGKLGLRPGLRLEGDDYMEKKTIAPRFAGDYDVFGDRSTVLVFGANRYYGRNLFKYRLADGRGALNTNFSRTSYGGTWRYTQQKSVNKFSTLDIPYDDEFTVGVEQRWWDTDFNLKYVHREGKDKVVRATAAAQGIDKDPNYATVYYNYTNEGSSTSDTVTLSITPLRDLQFLDTSTSLQLAFDWSQSEDAYGNYDSSINADEFTDENVLYKGSLMKYSELPASDFNRPWTARLTTVTEIPRYNLTLSNFLRYRGPYEQIFNTGDSVVLNGEDVEVYDTVDVSAAPTWDLRLKWEVPFAQGQAVYTAVDVVNVMDRVNEIVTSGDTGTTLSYETGRQYWLEVGYRF